MQNFDIRNKCKVNTNFESDTFVGLKCDNGEVSISFPLGYSLSSDERELRKDITLLLSTLAIHISRKDSEVLKQSTVFNQVDFPMQAFMYLIKDFFARGYFHEQEVTYKNSKTGKINWNRTIKSQKPYVQDNTIFYLDFVTKSNNIREIELITLIHEYCVYESFNRIGWLFTNSIPKQPKIKRNTKLFRSVLRDKIANTFNDKNRLLFINMLAIVEYKGDSDAEKNYRYGTYRFEYVWESMIDKIFGIENKADYFPKTSWLLKGNSYPNASLEPDTIMLYKGNVFILDAKYYKYGVLPSPIFLPESTSINKQITYGEYVANEKAFRKIHGNDMQVYNAFLMPFDAAKWRDNNGAKIVKIGEAISNWKDNDEKYQHIQGILVDVKTLMGLTIRRDQNEIMMMAELIENM